MARARWLIPFAFHLGCVSLATPWEQGPPTADASCGVGHSGCESVDVDRGPRGAGGGSAAADGSFDLPRQEAGEPADAPGTDLSDGPDAPDVAGTTGTDGMTGAGGSGYGENPSTDGPAGRLDAPWAGTIGSGGVTSGGGIVGTGGAISAGGAAGLAGATSAGGASSAGGMVNTGGIPTAGGTKGSGGTGSGGTGSGGSMASDCQQLSDCAATQVCNASKCGDPQGLVVLSVPFTASGQDQRYWFPFSPAADLTDKTVTLRAFAPGASAGVLNVYLSMSDATSTAGSGALVTLSELSKSWKDIAFNAQAAGNFDPAQVKQVTVEITSRGSGPWANPTVVYIDSLLISTLTLGGTFDSSIGSFTQSSTQAVAGSTLAWASALP